uniref:Ig-like domain-containing protein n=1 Tax=Rhinolophus ferrumequinum TaxID=59479 RepID=A0A671F3P2_RHIFE
FLCRPNDLVVLILCLPPRLLPAPSIRAQPGPVVPRGRPVTILCRGPAGADLFRLEHRSAYTDQKITSQHGSPGAEARFPIRAVSDITAGPYRCEYRKRYRWSERSEALELVLTDEEVPALPSGLSQVTGHWPQLCPLVDSLVPTPSSPGLPTQYVYVLTGVSVAFLLCLLLLVFLLLHRQHQKKHGPLSNKGEEQRPQESGGITGAGGAPGGWLPPSSLPTVPSSHSRPLSPQSPAAGDTQEVTYAQLDHRALTLRAARAVSPQATEPTADSNTYAALARR